VIQVYLLLRRDPPLVVWWLLRRRPSWLSLLDLEVDLLVCVDLACERRILAG
jgi:hypothetical protein